MEKILCTHDEIFLEDHAEMVSEVALILKRTMEEAGRTLLKIVSVKSDRGFFKVSETEDSRYHSRLYEVSK